MRIQGRPDRRRAFGEMLESTFVFDVSFYDEALRRRDIDRGALSAGDHYLMSGDQAGISPHPLLDVEWYRTAYPDVASSGMSAAIHYLTFGHNEDRNPHPLFENGFVRAQQPDRTRNPLLFYLQSFPGSVSSHPEIEEAYLLAQIGAANLRGRSVLACFLDHNRRFLNPSARFESRAYRALNPDIGDMHPLLHYVRWGAAEGRRTTPVAGAVTPFLPQIDEAAQLDPSVAPPHTEMNGLVRSFSKTTHEPSRALMRALFERVGSDVDRIVLVPRMTRGGGEKVVVNVLKALRAARPGERLCVLATDERPGSEPPIDLPLGSVTWADVSAETAVTHPRHRAQMLATFLEIVRPCHVYVMNSLLGWDALVRHGRALGTGSNLSAFAFCYDYDAHGRRAGYAWTHLGRAVENLTAVFSDNEASVETFGQDHRLTADDRSKFVVLRQPPDPWLRLSNCLALPARIAGRGRVLWAGRFHPQKNLPLALNVARLVSEAEFVFAGGTWSDAAIDGSPPPNATFVGPFDGFGSLDTAGFDAFLHTSSWDGLPNVIVEAGAAGLAVVARDVGGVRELVGPETGWLLSAEAGAGAMADALRAALAEPAERARRGRAIKALVAETHSFERLGLALLSRDAPVTVCRSRAA